MQEQALYLYNQKQVQEHCLEQKFLNRTLQTPCHTCARRAPSRVRSKVPAGPPVSSPPELGQKGVLAEPVLSAYSASSHIARLVLVFAIH